MAKEVGRGCSLDGIIKLADLRTRSLVGYKNLRSFLKCGLAIVAREYNASNVLNLQQQQASRACLFTHALCHQSPFSLTCKHVRSFRCYLLLTVYLSFVFTLLRVNRQPVGRKSDVCSSRFLGWLTSCIICIIIKNMHFN